MPQIFQVPPPDSLPNHTPKNPTLFLSSATDLLRLKSVFSAGIHPKCVHTVTSPAPLVSSINICRFPFPCGAFFQLLRLRLTHLALHPRFTSPLLVDKFSKAAHPLFSKQNLSLILVWKRLLASDFFWRCYLFVPSLSSVTWSSTTQIKS